MSELFLYICKYEYCNKEFKPKRRGAQKFCSATCRSKHWQLNNSQDSSSTHSETKLTSNPFETKPKSNKKLKKEMKKIREEIKNNKPSSLVDFLVSTAGTYAGSKLERATLKEENKPLTKGDMLSLLSNVQRFQKVNNLPPNEFGQLPFIDITTGNIEYIGKKNSFLDF